MAISSTIDFTAETSGAGLGARSPVVYYDLYIDTAATNLGTDEYALFDVPGGLVHLSTLVEVITAEGGTATATIGITGALTTYCVSVNLNATAGTFFTDVDAGNALGGATAGYVVPAAGETIYLDPQNAMDAGQFRITVAFLDMRGESTQMPATA